MAHLVMIVAATGSCFW